MIGGLLDRYVLRQFFIVFVVSLAGFLAVCLLGDYAERLSKFVDSDAPKHLILMFYIYQIPYYLIFVLPASSLIATLFTLGHMMRHNELTAMRSSGISLARIFTPLYIFMAVLSLTTFYANETIVPKSNQMKTEIMDYEIRGKTRPSSQLRHNLDYLGDAGRRWQARSFILQDSLMRDVRLLGTSYREGRSRIDYRIDAAMAKYSNASGWSFTDGTMRDFSRAAEEKAYVFDTLTVAGFKENPVDFTVEMVEPDEMNFQTLKNVIEKKERNGLKVSRDKVILWIKTAMPLTSFIIVLFGAPLAVSRKKMGAGFGAALGLVVYMAYMASFYLSRSLGYSGFLNPIAAAWASNVIFGIGGLLLFTRVRK